MRASRSGILISFHEENLSCQPEVIEILPEVGLDVAAEVDEPCLSVSAPAVSCGGDAVTIASRGPRLHSRAQRRYFLISPLLCHGFSHGGLTVLALSAVQYLHWNYTS